MRLQDSHNSPEYVYKIAKTHRPELQNSNTVIKPTQAKDTPKERTGSHPAFYAPYLAKNAKLHAESRRKNSEKPYTAGYSDFDKRTKDKAKRSHEEAKARTKPRHIYTNQKTLFVTTRPHKGTTMFKLHHLQEGTAYPSARQTV